jgi:uncharacterized protein YodC (DUF2158 family)
VKQKFFRGDLVRVAEDLGPMMSHFTGDCDALVLGSYNDQYGGGNVDSYSLLLMPDNRQMYRCSWYHEHQLKLLRKATMVHHYRIQKYLSKDL